jgi:adenosylcobinamide kinase / adenosylcobinamide-phosphate guanylyltransferase
MLTLITGGARSGKSTFAQSLCAASGRVIYVATATCSDDEMRERIQRHKQVRPPTWFTIEEPIAIARVAKEHAADSAVVLIDCLTLWISNVMFELRGQDPAAVEQIVSKEAVQLIEAAKHGSIIAVTNEVGSGVVPEDSVGRRFRDLQGFINQQIASAAGAVYLLVSGIALCIKSTNEGNRI